MQPKRRDSRQRNTGQALGRRTAIIDRAAETLQRLLGEAGHEVVVEHRTAELFAPSNSCVVRLDGLIGHLLEPSHVTGPPGPNRDPADQETLELGPDESRLIEAFIERAVDSASHVQTIRLHDWPMIENRLMVRLTPNGRAGAIARPIGHDLIVEVGIDLPHAVAIPTERQLTAWRRPAATIWAAALSNTHCELNATMQRVELRPKEAAVGNLETTRLVMLSGSPWTSGAIPTLDQLMPARSHHLRYASLFDWTTLAIFEPLGQQPLLESSVAAMTAAWFDQLPGGQQQPGFNLFQIGPWPAIRPVY